MKCHFVPFDFVSFDFVSFGLLPSNVVTLTEEDLDQADVFETATEGY
jgi:hypothetical protein